MRLCTMLRNYTVAYIEVKANNFMIVEEKRITGIIGSILHKYFRLDYPNRCKFISVQEFGTRLKNLSYTGAIKLFKERKIDSFGRPQPQFYKEDFLVMSDVVYEDQFFVGQILRDKFTNNMTGSLKMFDFEIWLILFPVLIFLFTFLVLLKILPIPNSYKKMQAIVDNLFEINFRLTKQINAASIIILFHLIYFMIFKFIVKNNIKTSQVVIDTSEIVEDEKSLLISNKRICFWEGESEFRLINESPKDSFLNKLLIHHSSPKMCIFSSELQKFLGAKMDYDHTIWFLTQTNLLGVFSLLSTLLSNRLFYFNKHSMYNVASVFYYKQNIDPYFPIVPKIEFEHGIQEQVQTNIRRVLRATFEYKVKQLSSKKEYTDLISEIHDLDFNYIKDAFEILLIIDLIILNSFVFISFFKRLARKFIVHHLSSCYLTF